MMDLVGLLAAAALLITLVVLEVRRAGSNAGQPAPRRFLGRTVSSIVVAVTGTSYLLFFLPRVLGLLV